MDFKIGTSLGMTKEQVKLHEAAHMAAAFILGGFAEAAVYWVEDPKESGWAGAARQRCPPNWTHNDAGKIGLAPAAVGSLLSTTDAGDYLGWGSGDILWPPQCIKWVEENAEAIKRWASILMDHVEEANEDSYDKWVQEGWKTIPEPLP